MDFLTNIIPFISSIADFLVSHPIGLAFLGIGLFGVCVTSIRRLM